MTAGGMRLARPAAQTPITAGREPETFRAIARAA